MSTATADDPTAKPSTRVRYAALMRYYDGLAIELSGAVVFAENGVRP